MVTFNGVILASTFLYALHRDLKVLFWSAYYWNALQNL